MSSFINFFNINASGVEEELSKIRNTGLSPSDTIKAYKELYWLLLAKAKGDIANKKTERIVRLDEEGNEIEFGYEISKGKYSVFEKNAYKEITQSNLPNGKSFGEALVVFEVIQTLENGNQSYLSQDEHEDRYANLLKKQKREKLDYGDKEYTDAELME